MIFPVPTTLNRPREIKRAFCGRPPFGLVLRRICGTTANVLSVGSGESSSRYEIHVDLRRAELAARNPERRTESAPWGHGSFFYWSWTLNAGESNSLPERKRGEP